MKRKIIIAVASVLLLFLVLPLAAGYWVLYTDNGLQFALSQLDHLKKIVRIRITGVTGALARGVHIAHLTIEHERVAITIDDLNFRVQPRALLTQSVLTDSSSIGRARVVLLPRVHPPTNAPLKFLPQFLRIVSNDATISRAEVVLENHVEIDARDLHGTAILSSRHLSVTGAHVDGGFFTAAGTFDLGAAYPMTMSGDLSWTLLAGGPEPWRGKLRAGGNLDDLEVSAEQHSPIQARVTGRGLALTHAWRWEASIASPRIDFARLNPAVKITAADIALEVRGDRTGIGVTGSLRPLSVPTGKLNVSMKGPYPSRRVQLDSIAIQAAGGARIDASGVVNFVDGGPVIDLRGTAADVCWPMVGRRFVTSKAAKFTLAGPHLPYRFTADGTAKLPDLPAFDLLAEGLLDRDRIMLKNVHAGWLKGGIDASGQLGWTGRSEWNFAAKGQNLDPGLINSVWPGRLSFAASVGGAGLNKDADIDLTVTRVSGKLRGESLLANGRIERRGESIVIDSVNARFADAHARIDGKFGNPRDVRIDLDAPHLNRVLPGLAGSMTVHGHISGPPATAHLTGTLNARDLKFAALDAHSIHGSADIDLSDRLASHLDLRAAGVAFNEYRIGDVEALLDGSASDHRFSFSALGGLVDVRGALTGSYNPKGWRANITALTLHNGNDVDVHLEAPAALQWMREEAALQSLCLLGVNERVCAQGAWQRGGAFRLTASGNGIPLRALGANLPTKPEYMGSLSFDTEAHGRTIADVTGHLSVDLAEGNLRYKLPSGNEDTLHLGSGHGEIIATPAKLDAMLHLVATEQSYLDVKLNGARSASEDIFETPVTGEIHTQAHDLGFIALLVDQIDRAVGQLNADFAVSGTLAAPELSGAVILKDGELDLYQFNLLMRAINARIDVAGTEIGLAASANIGAGKAGIAGKLAWTDRKPVGQIKLTGVRLKMVDIPELHADASPDLNFKIDGRRIDVSGTVTIPYARIKPADLTGAVLSSGDEIIVGQQSGPDDQRLQIYTDVKLALGTDVTVDTYGLTGRLTGSVSASSDPSGNARGSGELKIEEGRYAAYGRQLDIQRGRLIFNGGLVSDPAVDLRAVKVFPDVTAGVNVRGKLRNPQISFFSDPSLTQTQIVSVLVAGGTIESLQKSGTQQVGQARNELLAQGGAIVAQQLGARLGVEDVGLESDTLNQTSLVLGKFLNPRLYVSYGISLTESINTVKLRYTLGDHWTIKTEAGQNRSSDLIFTIER
jgi:translocation and assembly module TamB